jgi:hypothetical protein
MRFPIKTCVVCGEEFELRPEKPGFAKRCCDCSREDAAKEQSTGGDVHDSEQNAARREAMKSLLYRKDS